MWPSRKWDLPLELALCGAQNSKWPDVARKLQNGWMCRANNFRTLFRPYSGESVIGSPIPGKEHGENMNHFFSMFLEKHE